MKKIFLVIICLIINLSIVGCKQNDNVIKIGQVANDGKLKIMFEDATEVKTVKSDNMFVKDDVAEEGKVFIVMYFDIENLGNKDDGINTFTDVEYYADDIKANSKMILNKPNSNYENLFGLIEIAPGKKSKQCVVFEANENWKKAEMIYQEAFDKDAKKYIFAINKEDLGNKNNNKNVAQNADNGYIKRIKNYNFVIPNIFQKQEESEKSFRAQVKENEGVSVILQILYATDDEDVVSFDILEKETKNGEMQDALKSMLTGFDNVKFINCEKIINNEIKGYTYNYTGRTSGINCSINMLVFGDEEGNGWFYVLFIDVNSDYNSTFDEIVSKITKS